ncbi:E3 ubiquitin-protein ligase boi, partial [Phtheirospermum japonicum]
TQQNKRLTKLILEEQKRQQAVLLLECESRIKNLMLQKDEELALARNKTSELQDFMRVAEMETKAWEKKAIEKGAIAADLQTRLNQVKNNKVPNPGGGVESKIEKMMGGYCKLCQLKSLCVVFFPCRHLCCCKSCEPLLGHCPVCQTVKEGCLEVFLG